MFILEADDQPVVPERSPWRIRRSYSYACVAAPGRRAGDIGGDKDIGWPFIVEGEIDDQTLVSVFEFIRSKPLVAEPKVKNAAPIFVPDAPVSSMRRRADEIEVVFRLDDAQGQSVRLARKDGRWIITDFDWWIV